MTDSNDHEPTEEIDYDPESDVYLTRYDEGTFDAPSTAIVYGLAAAMDRDPAKISPLYDSVDPDAIDRLFDPCRTADGDLMGKISFVHSGHTIVVRSTGEIVIRPNDSEE